MNKKLFLTFCCVGILSFWFTVICTSNNGKETEDDNARTTRNWCYRKIDQATSDEEKSNLRNLFRAYGWISQNSNNLFTPNVDPQLQREISSQILATRI